MYDKYDNYFKLKKILSIISDADRHDQVAWDLRACLTITMLEKMQDYIAKTEAAFNERVVS